MFIWIFAVIYVLEAWPCVLWHYPRLVITFWDLNKPSNGNILPPQHTTYTVWRNCGCSDSLNTRPRWPGLDTPQNIIPSHPAGQDRWPADNMWLKQLKETIGGSLRMLRSLIGLQRGNHRRGLSICPRSKLMRRHPIAHRSYPKTERTMSIVLEPPCFYRF